MQASDQSFQVVVLNSRKVLYSGNAVSLSSVNDKGKFDILAQHANFISIIGEKLILRDDKDRVLEYTFNSGILRVSKQRVEVFLGAGAG